MEICEDTGRKFGKTKSPLVMNLQLFANKGEGNPTGNLVNGIPNNPGIVRRFMSKAEYKDFMKNGFKFDPSDSRGGISSTSIKVKPINPDSIKRSTGALGADYYVDIDVSNKNVILKGITKGGVADFKIQDNVSIEDIINSGRVRK